MKRIDVEQFEGHTPGEWRTTEGSYGNYVGVVGGSSLRKTVCRVPWGNRDGYNANLIAAAPALLAALKEAYARIDALESGLVEVDNLVVAEILAGSIRKKGADKIEAIIAGLKDGVK